MEVKQVIVVRKDLNMRKGKLAAQVARASMISILDHMKKFGKFRILYLNSKHPMNQWLEGLFTKIVVGIANFEELSLLIDKAKKEGIQISKCIDAGKTEFGGKPTLTCVAFGPDFEKKMNKITGNLKLL